MEEKKTFWQTAIETLRGANNEGSSKRATAAYITVVLITICVFVFMYGLYVAYMSAAPTSVHLKLVSIGEYITYALLISALAALGLTNIDKWIDVLPFRKVSKENNDTGKTNV